jgi:hypothetical protein
MPANAGIHFDLAPVGPIYTAVRHRSNKDVMPAKAGIHFDLAPVAAPKEQNGFRLSPV